MMFILQATGNPLPYNMIFLLAILAVMYFFFMRPQIKKQKAQDKFVKELKKGDEVVTTSGMIGKINKIENGIVQLQIDQKTFIRFVENVISREMTDNLHKEKS